MLWKGPTEFPEAECGHGNSHLWSGFGKAKFKSQTVLAKVLANRFGRF